MKTIKRSFTNTSIKSIATLTSLLATLISTPALAENDSDQSLYNQDNAAQNNAKGIWTFGVGLATARFSHYRGSDQSRTIALPFPYIHYKSKKVTIDREGIKSQFFSGKNWDMSLSGGGQIKVNSDDNRAREGMPDLAWVGSVGPVLNYYLSDDKNQIIKWHLRKAISFEDGLESVGFVSELAYRQNIILPSNSWGEARLVTTASLNFSSSKYNDYLYGVAPQYATANRPAYSADSGFAGTQLRVSYQLQNHQGEDKFRAAAFILATNLSGSEFEDSPLVKQTTNVSFGLMYAWLF